MDRAVTVTHRPPPPAAVEAVDALPIAWQALAFDLLFADPSGAARGAGATPAVPRQADLARTA